jgi:hypothetical protein
LRVIVGLLITCGIEYGYSYITQDIKNFASIFVLRHIVFYIVVTFFVFGILPEICESIGVTRSGPKLSKEFNLDFKAY